MVANRVTSINQWYASLHPFLTSINQWYASLHIPLVGHSGAFTDWLKFVPAVIHHFWLLNSFIFSLLVPLQKNGFLSTEIDAVIMLFVTANYNVLLWQLTSILGAINKYIMGY